MSASTASGRANEKDPNMPPLCRVGDLIAPKTPHTIAAAGVEEGVLTDLVLRLGYTVARFTTEWVGKQLQMSPGLTGEVLEKLCFEGLVEQLWQTSKASSHYKITDQGREHAKRLMEICGYIGPAPVSLEAYAAMLRWQFAHSPPVEPEHVAAALSGLVLSERAAQLAGLAVSSGRSLFIYGPPGNGKSTLGRQVHAALEGDCWIPYAISVGETVIRLFDAHVHRRVDIASERLEVIDQRWIRIRRPLVVVGGELTLDLLDLIFVPSLRYYE